MTKVGVSWVVKRGPTQCPSAVSDSQDGGRRRPPALSNRWRAVTILGHRSYAPLPASVDNTD